MVKKCPKCNSTKVVENKRYLVCHKCNYILDKYKCRIKK